MRPRGVFCELRVIEKGLDIEGYERSGVEEGLFAPIFGLIGDLRQHSGGVAFHAHGIESSSPSGLEVRNP